MAIYRGTGGSGDATGNVTITEIQNLRSEAAQSATDAEVSNQSALTAQTAAELAETNAETAETNAETAQSLAEAAQTAAELAQTNAETAETNAETAETNAETAQAAAETAQSNAEAAEDNALVSETNALNYSNSASTSAGTATTQAGVATTQASNAATSASTATTQASNASTSASAASSSASSAASSATSAAQSAASAATLLDNPIFRVFSTVSEMVADTNLTVGMKVRTLGYYAAGDGGGNDYSIVAAGTGTADGGSYINLATHQAQGLFTDGKHTVKQFGAKGGGVTVDSTFVSAAIDYGLANDVAITFTEGKYIATLTKAFTVRLKLIGEGLVTITGAIVLNGTFVVSADVGVMDEDSAFLTIEGIDFRGTGASYALTVTAQDGFKFIDTLSMRNCRFWGRYGFFAENLITVNLSNCWFYNTAIGLRGDSCTNWSVTNCKWRNASQYGAYFTKSATTAFREGGENLRLISCEFDVCTIGLYIDRHQWAAIESCLFDYCQLPAYILGSLHTKASDTYFGNSMVGALTADPDYIAPPSNDISLLVKPAKPASTIFTAGITCIGCEFITYDSGSTQPIVLLDGFLATDVGTFVEQSFFSGCLFLMTQSHSANNLMTLSYCANVRVTDNIFNSFNLSSTLGVPYSVSNSSYSTSMNNDVTLCQESSTVIPSIYEESRVSKLKMARDAGGFQILNESDEVIGEFDATGGDRVRLYFSGQLQRPFAAGNDTHSPGFSYVLTPNV